MGMRYRIFWERGEDAGVGAGHYFHQDLLVAREIFARAPHRHIDVGSSILGFVSHVASFREIEVLDIRPLESLTPGISFTQADVMTLGPEWTGVTDSLSCLHALEHFGLGRYGDPIDVDGWRKGLASLTRMLEPQGRLYLSVPTGSVQRTEFNAHRVFCVPFLRDVLLSSFSIERLAFVDDMGSLHPDEDPFGAGADSSFNAQYGCSIWFLRKR